MPDSPTRPARLLVYVDDSQHGAPAIRMVGDLARGTGAHVTLLATAWLKSARDDAFAKARGILSLPADRVTMVERPGLVEYVLPEAAAGHDLVVVGRLGSLDWLTNRLLSVHLVRRTPANILLVRGKEPRLERILAATEGPRHGGKNVRAATSIAKLLGARISVLHVRNEMALTERAHEDLAPAAFLESARPEAVHLREVQASLASAGVRAAMKVRIGSVVDEVLAEVTEGQHDLVVLGAHEQDPEDSFYYEDITALLVRACPVSCLVVREPWLSP